MTTQVRVDARASAPERADAPRLIAVGVRAVERDSDVIAWAAGEARAGIDVVHLVHAFIPVVATGCSWDPVQRARDSRRSAARMVISRTLPRVRCAYPGLEVDGSAVAGAPVDVLLEFSDIVDLIVVGDHDLLVADSALTARGLARRCRCPLAVVPRGYRHHDKSEKAVTVLVDEAGLLTVAVEAGLAEAERRGTSLRVAQFWSDLHTAAPSSPDIIAEHQLQLDMQLADLRERHPHVGVVGELLANDTLAALTRLRSASQLVIATSRSRHLTPLLIGSEPGACPTLIVPAAHPPLLIGARG